MRFDGINVIYPFIAAACLILFYIWALKAKRARLKLFMDKELAVKLSSSFDSRKWKIKAFMAAASLFFFMMALARPMWGFHWEEVKKKGLDIIIAIDTSKSMLAEDIKPNRLERSKLAITDLVRKLKGDRVGLIAFSGTAFLQCPLTIDYSGFLLTLDDLSAGIIPRGGTSISSAIREAVKCYRDRGAKYKILILITDGEDHEGDPIKAAELAKKEGVTIFAIGIGTKEGELIPITDAQGKAGFLKDKNGNIVKTSLDEETLKKIALMTDGSYVRATSSEFGLELIYDEKLSKFEKTEIESKMQKHYEERFQIPLVIGLIFLFFEMLISDRRSML